MFTNVYKIVDISILVVGDASGIKGCDIRRSELFLFLCFFLSFGRLRLR